MRLQAEARAAEEARKQAEAKAAEEAAAEAKRKREVEREAARQALRQASRVVLFLPVSHCWFLFCLPVSLTIDNSGILQMEKTVEINENSLFMKDLEILGTAPEELMPDRVPQMRADHLQGLGGFSLGRSNPLEQLGLFRKDEEEEEEECGPTSFPGDDIEDGEID